MHFLQNKRRSYIRCNQELFWLRPEAQLNRRVKHFDPLLVLLPFLMTLHEKGFNLFFGVTGCQVAIAPAGSKCSSGFVISMRAKTAHDTAERLLIRPVFAIHIMTARALLRTVGGIDGLGGLAAAGTGPG